MSRSRPISSGPKVTGRAAPIFTPGPAVIVVRGGHHRHRRRIERKLGEIGHRGDRKADVAHSRSARHQPRCQRELDRGGIAAEVVADHDVAWNAELLQKAREPEAERLHAHQVDLLLDEPARVIFAKPGRLDHRLRLVGGGVGEELWRRLGEQSGLGLLGDNAPGCVQAFSLAAGRRPGLDDAAARDNPRVSAVRDGGGSVGPRRAEFLS